MTAVRELQEETSISSVEVRHPLVHGMCLVYASHACTSSPCLSVVQKNDPKHVKCGHLMCVVQVVASASTWLKYDYPFTYKCSVRQHYVKYDGQVQQWYLMRFTGNDSEVNLFTAHQEFKAWQWMPLLELPDSVIDFKKELYIEVVREFLPHLSGVQTHGPASGQPSLQ